MRSYIIHLLEAIMMKHPKIVHIIGFGEQMLDEVPAWQSLYFDESVKRGSPIQSQVGKFPTNGLYSVVNLFHLLMGWEYFNTIDCHNTI